MDTDISPCTVATLCCTPEAAATVRHWPAALLSTVLDSAISRLKPLEAVEILKQVGAEKFVHPIGQATLNLHLRRYSTIHQTVPKHVEDFLKTLIVGLLDLPPNRKRSSLYQCYRSTRLLNYRSVEFGFSEFRLRSSPCFVALLSQLLLSNPCDSISSCTRRSHGSIPWRDVP